MYDKYDRYWASRIKWDAVKTEVYDREYNSYHASYYRDKDPFEHKKNKNIQLSLIKEGKLLFIKALINGNIDENIGFSEIYGNTIFEVMLTNYSDNNIETEGFGSNDNINNNSDQVSTINKKVNIKLNSSGCSTILQFDSEEERDMIYDGILSIMKNLTRHLKSRKKEMGSFRDDQRELERYRKEVENRFNDYKRFNSKYGSL